MTKLPRLLSDSLDKFTLCLGLVSLIVVSTFSYADSNGILPNNRVIVKYKESAVRGQGLTPAAMQALSAPMGKSVRVSRQMGNGAQVMEVEDVRSSAELQAVADQLAQNPYVEYAEPDYVLTTQAEPTDPLFADQWSLYEATGGIRLPAALDDSDGSGVVVAVVDTGVLPHVDLVGNLLPGYDFVSVELMSNDGDGRDADATDPGDAVSANECGIAPDQDQASSWHGTHVAGIIAAKGNNGEGISGIAPEAKILPVRTLGKCGGLTSDIVDGMLWAAGFSIDGVPDNPNPAKVINMSLGSAQPLSCLATYRDAIEQIRAAGGMVVVAAGNANDNADDYMPGNCEGGLYRGRHQSRCAAGLLFQLR